MLLCGDRDGQHTTRTIRPLGLYFWGNRWTIAAWCLLRNDYRNFRIDRLISAVPGTEFFDDSDGIDLGQFVAAMTARMPDKDQSGQ